MLKQVKEFEFELTEGLKYHKDGQISSGKKLVLTAPANAHRYQVTQLKQGFLRAIMSMQTAAKGKAQADSEEEAKLTGDTILTLLSMSDIDMNEYFGYFKELLCAKNICKIDGAIDMAPHIFDQISIDDGDSLLGKYIEVFLLSSWMQRLNQK